MALSKIERVHTVGTTISVTISMWLVKGSAKHTHTQILTTHQDYCVVQTLLMKRVMMLKHSTQRVNIVSPLNQIIPYLIYSEHE